MVNTINILGTDYNIYEVEFMPEDKVGRTDFIDKKIYILKEQDCKDIVLRHEITHAFFYECGLACYANDETLVDFLALNLYKLKHTIEDCKNDTTK